MLDKTDKAVAGLLEKLPDIIQGVVNQTPEITQELLTYGAFNAWCSIGFGVMLMLLALVCIKFYINYQEEIFIAMCIPLVIMGTLMTLVNINTLYKINYTPKLYIIEKTKEMISE